VSNAPPRPRLRLLVAAGFALFLVTAIGNVGIVASDDYWAILDRVLPGGVRTAQSVIDREDLRTPLPALIHLGLVTTAAKLGIDHPVNQVRFDQAVLAVITFWTVLWAGLAIFGLADGSDRNRHREIFAGLLGFYFASAFYLTRPMVETLTAPLLALGAAFACRYRAGRGATQLVWSVLAISAAAALRPQAGVAVLALPFVIGIGKRWKDLVAFAAAGLAGFVIAGLIDWLLSGAFHQSLRRYVAYNVAHSSEFGVSPPTTFPLLFAALTIPPVFFARYRGFGWRARYRPLLPAVAMFAVFVVAHSLVPHKEERFMVPILPLFLVLLVPVAAWLLEYGARWRAALFVVVNVVLLVLVVANPPQRTLMSLAAYLDRSPSVTELVYSKGLFLPAAFVTRPITSRLMVPDLTLGCDGRLAVLGLTDRAAAFAADPAWRRVAHFEPGPIERLVVRLNPKRNARRGPLDVYEPSGC
jgi:hypothetical protein